MNVGKFTKRWMVLIVSGLNVMDLPDDIIHLRRFTSLTSSFFLGYDLILIMARIRDPEP